MVATESQAWHARSVRVAVALLVLLMPKLLEALNIIGGTGG